MSNNKNFKDCSACNKTSNNKFFDCPPRMDDGRHFTDYRTQCTQNNQLWRQGNVKSSFDYRMYLTRNADKLLDAEREKAGLRNSCGPCMEPYDVGTMLPEKNMVTCNQSTCSVNLNNEEGLGTGRQYDTNVQKPAVSPENNSTSVPCCGTPSDMNN